MPPRIKLKGIKQIALPFDQPTYQKEAPSLEPPSAVYIAGSSGHQEVADDDEDEPGLRVTTRARFSYELDTFQKNAMLIINNCNDDAYMTLYFFYAFRNLRFELTAIETEQDSKDGIWQKVDQFFRRDFTNYGAVAVVTANCPDQHASERDNCVKEWDVLNYFLLNQPPTLQDKPKIFITEALEPTSPPEAINLPSDIILVQTKNVSHEKYTNFRPLDFLCHKFISMEGHQDLLDILSEVNYEAAASYPNSNIIPINYLNMLTKELLFQKDNAKETTLDDITAGFADPVLFQICWRLFVKVKSEKDKAIMVPPSEVIELLLRNILKIPKNNY